jgi:DNA-binding LacI/PurR family transcriptional regulator
MADVAERAGVSIMTVSRVLNGFTGVAPETRQRVEAAIADLGYRANTAARILAGGRSRTLGLIAVEPEHYGPVQLLYGVEAAARSAGHGFGVITFDPKSEDLPAALENLRSAQVEGVVIEAPVEPVVEALRAVRPGVPAVVVGGDPALPMTTVAVDQAAGGRLATEHLLGLGHRSVHHVRGDAGWVDAELREQGWSAALEAAGATGRLLRGDWTAAGGYEAGRELVADPEATAVFAANDQTALGVLRALHEADRPDVSVVGFDDTPDSGYFVPPLTTVRQDLFEVARRAVELLLAEIDEPGEPRHVVVAPELVTRDSARPAPRSGS